MLQYNDRITPLTASKEIGEDYERWKNMEGIRRMARSMLTRSKRGGRIWKEWVEIDKGVLTRRMLTRRKLTRRRRRGRIWIPLWKG